VICTVVSHDLENETDMLALIGTSAALTISGLPFMGPLGGTRVGRIDGELILNPTVPQIAESDLDLIVAGTQEGVLMVESEASEFTEEQMLEAVMFGHKGYQPVIDAIIELAEACAKEPRELPAAPEGMDAIKASISAVATDELRAAYGIRVKSDRQAKIADVKRVATEKLKADVSIDQDLLSDVLSDVFKSLEKDIVRNDILDTGERIDGRDTKTVRPIACEVGILPRAHGSALFTRGETQAMVTTTLGTGQDEQIIDSLAENYRENFMLHYNFPPFSVGEAGRFGFTGRREVGHGKLAWRAMHPVMPSKEEFPYTVRVVSDVTESNGSSSMATVCGTSLSLMDAGAPLARPVAGIAMGLIKEGERYAVLSDILGDEDHLGDMDFKVSGTETGVTSLQMDIKITSITEEIMKIALEQAKEGRLHILDEMSKALSNSRDSVSGNAPRVTAMQINPEKIRDIIGPGGKIIREICETTGVKIDVEDDGSVRIAAVDAEAGDRAAAWIRDIVAEPEVGVIYDGKVVKTVDFGAFVNFLGPRDGLVHISEMAEGRVEKVSDVVNEGDAVKVKLIGIDDRGKVKLSMRVVNQETGEDMTEEVGERKKRP
jgi:polyribonucleotide nucleotidyltransferase